MTPHAIWWPKYKNMELNNAYEMVRAFHQAFGVPVENAPKLLDEKRAAQRAEWMREEIMEFLDAADICAQADGMIDLIYFALGTLVEMGVEPQKLFEIVHQANMDKLWPDGKPHYNQDSKVIKPVGWQPPEPKMELEIARQMDNQ